MNTLKTISRLSLTSLLIIALTYSCSSNDEGDTNDNPQGETKISFTVSGSPASKLNGVYNINLPDNDDQAATMALGGIYNEVTDEGTVKVVSLNFAYFVSDDDYFDITLKMPATIGSHTLGEFQTTSTGIISEEPTYHMVLSFDPQRAFYDGNNDMSNDILTDLLSKNVVVSITDYEETTNSLGITTLAHIKGSIGASGNQFFFKAFTGPTSDPEDLFCNVTATFEYTITE